MRDAFIHRKLKHLRINHDEFTFFRREFIQQRHNHRVDGNRFTRTRCTRNEEMWHLRQINNDGLTTNVFTQRQRQFCFGGFKRFMF